MQDAIEIGAAVYLNGDTAITGTVSGYGGTADGEPATCYLVTLDEGAWHGDYSAARGLEPGTMWVQTIVATPNNVTRRDAGGCPPGHYVGCPHDIG